MATKDIDWLVIAEKETQAQSYADALFDKGKPKGSTVKGGMGGNQLSSILGGNVVVTRAQGHLFEMVPPNEQDPQYDRKGGEVVDDWGMVVKSGWKSEQDMLDVYPVHLNIADPKGIKYEARTGRHKALATNLKQLVSRSKRIIVGTDGDAEGEMIFQNFRHIMLGAYGVKEDQLYRVLPASMDVKSVRSMFQNTMQRYDKMDPTDSLGSFYKGLQPKGYARAVADYEYGMTYSLLGSLVSQEVGTDVKSANGVWGRLKNTILGHVRQAEQAHDGFVPSSKYRVDMVSENGVKVNGSERLIFDTQEQAQAFIQNNKLPSRVNIQGKTEVKATLPPKLFSRSELLVAVDKRTSVKGANWADALQSDYEVHKIISYPRSDSQFIGNEGFNNLKKYVQQPEVVKLLQSEMKANAQKVTDGSAKVAFNLARKANKKWVDDAKVVPHFALVPNEETTIGPSTLSRLREDERALYLVALYQTMTLFVTDEKSEKHSVELLSYKEKPLFKHQYTRVLEQGWRLLNGQIQKSDVIPEYGEQAVTYAVTEVPAKQPSLLTEGSLLTKLKQRNEGTSATRDKTIEAMIKKKGIVTKGKELRVVPKLAPVVDYMLQQDWINMDQTSMWQDELDNIQTMNDADIFIKEVRLKTDELQQHIRRTLKV